MSSNCDSYVTVTLCYVLLLGLCCKTEHRENTSIPKKFGETVYMSPTGHWCNNLAVTS